MIKKWVDEYRSNVYTLNNFPIPASMKKQIKYIHYEDTEYANTYYVTSTYEAGKQIRQDMEDHYHVNSLESPPCRVDIVELKKIIFTDRSAIKSKDIKKTRMKKAKANEPLQYNFFTEDKRKLINEDQCVYDNFLSTYPHISEDDYVMKLKPLVIKSQLLRLKCYNMFASKKIYLMIMHLTF